jgi:hypothetical protein
MPLVGEKTLTPKTKGASKKATKDSKGKKKKKSQNSGRSPLCYNDFRTLQSVY